MDLHAGIEDFPDTRFGRWKEIAKLVEDNTNLAIFLSDKIKAIDSDENGSFFIYQPSASSEKSFRMKIDTNDLRSAGIATLSNGVYEPGVEDVMEKILAGTTVFVDIGANVGFYTCLATALNEDIKVLCIEPNPEVRERLNSNLMLNGIQEVASVIPYGVGMHEGEVEFYVPPLSGTGAGSLINLHPEEGEPEAFAVQVKTLDNLLVSLSKVDLIKMDIEGAEYQALKSGLESIERFKPIIVVELLRKWMHPFGSSPQEVVQMLYAIGYRTFAISDLGLREIHEIDEATQETNFLFYPSNRDRSVIDQLVLS